MTNPMGNIALKAEAPSAVEVSRLDAEIRAEIENWKEWHADRVVELSSELGWLTLISFDWIGWQEQTIRDFPGTFQVISPGDGRDDILRCTFDPEDGVRRDGRLVVGTTQVELANEESQMTFLAGRWVAEVIRRSNRYAIRVRRADAPARTNFQGVRIWHFNARWHMPGRICLRKEPEQLTRTTARPDLIEEAQVVADLRLTLPDGTQVCLKLEGDKDELFILNFHDETNGTESADWRFLSIPSPWEKGWVESDATEAQLPIDFNYALNFPAAFTDYSTCPQPLPGNDIPLPIRAGEARPIR